METGRHRATNILPEKLREANPLIENLLFEEHTSNEQDGNADPVEIDAIQIKIREGVERYATKENEKLK